MNERDIFLAAIEISEAAERAAYVVQTCGADAGLRARVEELLQARLQCGQLLETPAAAIELTVEPNLPRSSSNTEDDLRIEHAAETEFRQFLQPATRPGSLGRLAHYEIESILGQGAFGIVAKAFDEKLHRVVAIKLMRPDLASTSPPRKRFLREARTAAAVTHENIVAIHAVEEDPIPYLVMEYLPGQTLQQRMDEHGPLDVAVVLRIGQQVAAGLAAAHAVNLIHRDIKPSNILLTGGPHERAKISDFGLARAVDDASLTSSGMIAGTPLYMSPEQARGETLDSRTDLFSLGSVLYQMTGGRPPFRASNTIAVLKRVCDDTPRPLTDVVSATPGWLETIVFKLLEKKRENRYQTAQEVADLLTRCRNELEHHGSVTCIAGRDLAAVKHVLPPNTKTGVPVWKKPFGWLAGGVVAVATLAGLMLLNDKEAPLDSDRPSSADIEQVAAENESASTPLDTSEASANSPSAAQVDPHRRAAEAVLMLGGKVVIQPSDLSAPKTYSAINELPAAPFLLGGADLTHGRDVSDGNLPDFAGVPYLPLGLKLTNARLTAAGLQRLNDVAIGAGLVLSNISLAPTGLDQLVSRPDLPALNLCNFEQPIDGPLAESLCAHFPHLRSINLQRNVLTPDGARALARHSSLDQLLNVSTTVAGVQELAAMPRLRQLDFSAASDLGDECVEALSQFSQLTFVNLYRTKVSATAAQQLQERLPQALVYHPDVPALPAARAALMSILEHAGTATGWHAAASTDQGFGQPLVEVPVGNFSVQVVRFLRAAPQFSAESLAALRGLEQLHLSGLIAADEQAEALAQLHGLSELVVRDSDLGDAGLQRLSALTGLTRLSLTNCPEISEAGCANFQSFAELQVLSLSGASFADAGLAPLGQLPRLQELYLSSCRNLTSEGLLHLASLQQLRSLYLHWTQIDDAAIPHLSKLTGLRVLVLSNTKVTPAALAALQRALPLCVLHYDNKWLIPPLAVSANGQPMVQTRPE